MNTSYNVRGALKQVHIWRFGDEPNTLMAMKRINGDIKALFYGSGSRCPRGYSK